MLVEDNGRKRGESRGGRQVDSKDSPVLSPSGMTATWRGGARKKLREEETYSGTIEV